MKIFFILLFFLECFISKFTRQFSTDISTPFFKNLGMGMQTYGGTNNYQHSSYFYNFYWKDLEPTKGNIQYNLIDAQINNGKLKNELLGFRISSFDDDNDPIPGWLKTLIGEGELDKKGNWIPNQNNVVFLSELERLIKEVGDRYNGNKWIEYVDIGSIGYWGEWHLTYMNEPNKTNYMPNSENKKKIVDLYFDAFNTTQLVSLCGKIDVLEYAASKGAGFRCDCFGDYSSGWNHMTDSYPDRIAIYGNNWTTAPVMWETCDTINSWVSDGYDLERIWQDGIDWHTSALSNKNEAIPGSALPSFNNFISKIGYRYILSTIELETSGDFFNITSTWKNEGVVPTYLDLQLLWIGHYSQSNNTQEFNSSLDFRLILPDTQNTIIQDLHLKSNKSDDFDTLKVCLFFQPEIGRRIPIRLGLVQKFEDDGCYFVFCEDGKCYTNDELGTSNHASSTYHFSLSCIILVVYIFFFCKYRLIQ